MVEKVKVFLTKSRLHPFKCLCTLWILRHNYEIFFKFMRPYNFSNNFKTLKKCIKFTLYCLKVYKPVVLLIYFWAFVIKTICILYYWNFVCIKKWLFFPLWLAVIILLFVSLVLLTTSSKCSHSFFCLFVLMIGLFYIIQCPRSSCV